MGCVLRRIPLHYSWFLLFFGWVAYQLQAPQINKNSLLHSYFDDLVVIPIVLGGILMIFRNLIFRTKNYVFPKSRIWIVVAIFSIYFEVILPEFNHSFTADYFDVLCYGFGGVIFQLLINKPLGEEKLNCEV